MLLLVNVKEHVVEVSKRENSTGTCHFYLSDIQYDYAIKLVDIQCGHGDFEFSVGVRNSLNNPK